MSINEMESKIRELRQLQALIEEAQVAALFELEAILIGTENCVPESRAVVLFGKEAVEYVRKLSPGSYWNVYTAGGCAVEYLTFRGFQAAASFHNVQLMSREAQA